MAADARHAGRARYRNLADLHRGAARIPHRVYRARQGLRVRRQRRGAAARGLSDEGCRALHPYRSARPPAGDFQRLEHAALRRRHGAVFVAPDHSAEQMNAMSVYFYASDVHRRRELGGLPLPFWGEGWGEGVTGYRETKAPHPTPLPMGSSMHTSRDMLTHRTFMDCADAMSCDSMPADHWIGGRRWTWTSVSAASGTSG